MGTRCFAIFPSSALHLVPPLLSRFQEPTKLKHSSLIIQVDTGSPKLGERKFLSSQPFVKKEKKERPLTSRNKKGNKAFLTRFFFPLLIREGEKMNGKKADYVPHTCVDWIGHEHWATNACFFLSQQVLFLMSSNWATVTSQHQRISSIKRSLYNETDVF